MAEAAKKKRAVPKGRHLSQIKRGRQNEKRRAQNLQEKSYLKSAVKKVKAAVSQKNKELASKTLKEASRILQKAASKGVIHPRNAARRISRLAQMVHLAG